MTFAEDRTKHLLCRRSKEQRLCPGVMLAVILAVYNELAIAEQLKLNSRTHPGASKRPSVSAAGLGPTSNLAILHFISRS